MKTLLFVFSIVTQISVYSQNLKVSIIATKQPLKEVKTASYELISKDKKDKFVLRELKVDVQEGSGDYTYTWGSTDIYGITGDKASNRINVAINESDITYRVFVQDNKTGRLGQANINFKRIVKNNQEINVSVYPNPASNSITVSRDGNADQPLPTSIELFSDKSTNPLKTIPSSQLADKNYIFNTSDLANGVYYIHLRYKDDSKPRQIRVLLNQ